MKISLPAIGLVLFSAAYSVHVFAGVLSALFPSTWLGKNLFVVLPTIVVLFWSFLLGARASTPWRLKFFFAGVLAIVFIWSFLVGPVLLGQNETILAYLYPLAAPCAWLFECSFRPSQSARLRAVGVIIFVSVVAALLLHVNYIMFPSLSVEDVGEGIAEFRYDVSTTRSMLLNPSMHGSIVVLGMIAVLACSRAGMNIFKSQSVAILFIAFMFSSLFYGQSRTPLIFGCIVLVSFVWSSMSLWSLAVLSAGIALAIPLLDQQAQPFVQYIDNLLARSDLQEMGGRDIKFQLSLMLLTDTLPGFFVGLPSSVVREATLSGFNASDNSFFLVALRFGVPVSFLYFVCNFSIAGYRSFLSLSRALLVSLVLANLALTNSILWQPFILGSIVLLGALPGPRPKEPLKNPIDCVQISA